MFKSTLAVEVKGNHILKLEEKWYVDCEKSLNDPILYSFLSSV